MIPPLLVVLPHTLSPVTARRVPISLFGLRVLVLARRRPRCTRCALLLVLINQHNIEFALNPNLLFHLPFSVLVESLKPVFDRRAFLDYASSSDSHVSTHFLRQPRPLEWLQCSLALTPSSFIGLR